MEYVIQLLISGIAVGGTYALVALGFVLIFGVANILNIAQSETVMLGPMIALALYETWGMGVVPAYALALALTVGAGAAIHLLGVQPFLRRQSRGLRTDPLAPLIGTFGLGLAIQHITGAFVGTAPQPFPFSVRLPVWRVQGVAIDPMHVVSLAIAAALTVTLLITINRSGFGRAMRAVAENPAVAASLGVATSATTYLTTCIAAFFGAIAGLVFATATNSVNPFMGLTYGLKGLIVMIVGGVTSVPGAIVAGVVLGVIESLVTGLVSSAYRDVWAFALLIVILLFKREGLFAGVSRVGRP